MVNKFEIIVVGLIALIFIVVGEVMFTDTDRYVKYDCRYAEISPDFPPQAREICRGRK